jgi:hypothetical protein
MTRDDALAAAHRAANGVLRDWVRLLGLEAVVDRLGPAALAHPEPETVWLTLRPDKRPWVALAEREQLALEVFILAYGRGLSRVPPPPPAVAPRGRAHLLERIGDADDRQPGLQTRDRLR